MAVDVDTHQQDPPEPERPAEPPAIGVRSASGATVFPGLGDDDESRRVRAYLKRQHVEVLRRAEEHRAAKRAGSGSSA